MRAYCFGCKDLLSDRGDLTIIVVDETMTDAFNKAIKVLEDKGRHDLLEVLTFRGQNVIPKNGILFENVEGHRARDPEAAD